MTIVAPGARVALLAEQFVGMVEVENNRRWDNPRLPGIQGEDDVLRKMLGAAGWQEGWPYCMCFAEGLWRMAGAGEKTLQLLNPSVVRSAKAFEALGLLRPDPVIGAIMCLRKGNTMLGHAGVVCNLRADGTIGTIEGNTSKDAAKLGESAEREGGGIYRKTRPVLIKRHAKKLWTMGYIHPFPVL